MNSFSRRSVLAAAAAGSLAAAAEAAGAQTAENVPQPARPGRGGTDYGPRNVMRDQENPDLLVPPSTDSGTLPNLRFSFSDAHMRLETGGWTRQVTTRELGVAKEMAGVNMRLNAGGVRELHWHKASEWAYLLYGSARITAMDYDGNYFVDDIGVGDIWYFPSGVPHSIQGLGPDGCEFLLVFDDGDFDEDNTFMIADWFKHTPTRCSARISESRPRCSKTPRRKASATFSRLRCRDLSAGTRFRAQSGCRRPSVRG
jgi:oxalate decarboxylase